MSVAPAKKVKKESSFIALIKGCGCFFVLLIGFIAIIAGAGFYYFNPIVKSVRTEIKLPEFDGPTEQDFWSLQEKILNKKAANNENSENSEWDLTPGQFNAMLSSIQIPPVSGFCLNKVRHEYKDKELRYYLIGSGYTIKKLVISFVIFTDGKESYPSEIRVNTWKLPGDSREEKFVKAIITDVANADKSGLLEKIISRKIKPYE